MSRRDRSLLFLLVSAAAILISSCSTGSSSRLSDGGGSFGRNPPDQGILVYHDPAPRSGSFRRGRPNQPLTLTITTFSKKGMLPDQAITTQKGTLGTSGRRGQTTERDVYQELFRKARAESVFPTSPERFQNFLAGLEAVGIFKLPRGTFSPPDKPSIRLSAGGRTMFFLRPTDVPASQLPSSREELTEITRVWTTVKILIVNFVP